MKIDIHNNVGKVVDHIEIDKKFLVSDLNSSVVRQAVLSELTNLRQGTHSSKNRSAVRGGGKKPWKQKGRGVARAGTIRSPLWKGGGTIFGPEPHSYSHKLPKKINPSQYHLSRSKSLYQNKEYGLALIEIETAAKLTPSDLKIQEILAGMYSLFLRLDDAEKTVSHIIKSANTSNQLKSRSYQEWGDISILRGKIEKAKGYYEKA